MNIAISNIAWGKSEDKTILAILKKHHIKGIEIAPTKIWKNPIKASNKSINELKAYWIKNGISFIAMQSILFGHPKLTIFDTKEIRQKTLEYILKIIILAQRMGIKIMVFGSPKNRNIKNHPSQAFEIACEFFSKIGTAAKQHNIYFCIEPNPPSYGTNFINNTNEAIALIKAINHPNFRLHLDAGALALNNEDYEESIKKGFPYLSHFHISQPYLAPVGKGVVNHKKIAKILKDLKYEKWVSIEMINTNTKNSIETIDKTLAFVTSLYK